MSSILFAGVDEPVHSHEDLISTPVDDVEVEVEETMSSEDSNRTFEHDMISGIFGSEYNTTEALEQVHSSPFFYGSLGLVYGKEGSGKSWQLASLIGRGKPSNTVAIYIDADGANGKKFKEHCEKNGVRYINFNQIKKIAIGGKNVDITKKSKIKAIEKTIGSMALALKKDGNRRKLIAIIDSLSAIGEGLEINQSSDISPVLYRLDKLGQITGASIILIDHSTINDDAPDGFKLEGNAGAKRRTTTSTLRYIARHESSPQDGGKFVVERSRDADCFHNGAVYKVVG